MEFSLNMNEYVNGINTRIIGVFELKELIENGVIKNEFDIRKYENTIDLPEAIYLDVIIENLYGELRFIVVNDGFLRVYIEMIEVSKMFGGSLIKASFYYQLYIDAYIEEIAGINMVGVNNYKILKEEFNSISKKEKIKLEKIINDHIKSMGYENLEEFNLWREEVNNTIIID